MPVGAQPSKVTLDSSLNQIAVAEEQLMLQITRLQRGIGTWTDAQVAALGYDITTEVGAASGIIRPVISDMVQLKNIFYGTGTLAVVKDFSASFARVQWI